MVRDRSLREPSAKRSAHCKILQAKASVDENFGERRCEELEASDLISKDFSLAGQTSRYRRRLNGLDSSRIKMDVTLWTLPFPSMMRFLLLAQHSSHCSIYLLNG